MEKKIMTSCPEIGNAAEMRRKEYWLPNLDTGVTDQK